MNRLFFRISLRNAQKQGYISIINPLGLAIGFAGAFILLLYVFNELGYDSDIKSSDGVYRINTESRLFNLQYARTPFVLGTVLKDDLGHMILLSRVFNLSKSGIRKGEQMIKEDGIFCAENQIFKIMNLEIVAGNPDDLLNSPDDAVLTRNAAKKYFGEEMPLGKTLEIENNGDIFYFQVKGIINNIRENSSFRPEILVPVQLSIDQMDKMVTSSSEEPLGADYYRNNWNLFFFYSTYLKLEPGLSEDDLQMHIDSYEGKHYSEDLRLGFHLQKYRDIYFNSSHLVSAYNGGDIKTVIIYSMVAFLLLLTSSLNYILLSTAGLVKRRKEIAVKIVSGASHRSIVRQTMMETIGLSYIAALAGLSIAEIVLPMVSDTLFGKNISIEYLRDWQFTVSVLLIPLAVGLLSGIYLSVRITSKDAFTVLTHTGDENKGSTGFVTVLSTVQLIICMTLIACTGVIYRQIHYFRNTDPGFDIKNIISIDFSDDDIRKNYDVFKDELLKQHVIKSVSGAMWSPPTRSNMVMNLSKIDNPDEKVTVQGLMVDYDFAGTLGLNLIEGSDFIETESGSGERLIISRKAINALGIKGSPVGIETAFGRITGVVEDFHIHSFHSEVPPMIIQLTPAGVRTMLVRTEPGNTEAAINRINEIWEEMHFTKPPEYKLLSDALDDLYSEERRFASILTIFCALTLIVSVMGILGMAVLNTRNKTKEVGIRKVLGAESSGLMGKFMGRYALMILTSAAIAFPLAWLLMIRWLENFEYHDTVNIFAFAGSLLITVIVVLSSVAAQIIRLADTNPVDSLRYE